MKKCLRYLSYGLVLSSLNIMVATAQTLDFTRTIGGTAADAANSISIDGSGNILTAGKFGGGTAINFNPGGTAISLTSTGISDAYVGKYNSLGVASTGDIFKIGSTGTDFANKIYLDPSGNIYVIGTFSASTDFDPSSGFVGFQTGGGSGKGFIAKYNSTFGVQYTIAIGDVNTDIKDIAVDGSGNIYITGQFSGTVNFNPGTAPVSTVGAAINLTSNGGLDVFVAKYSSTGVCQWALNTGGASSDTGFGIDYDNAGNVYVTGIYRGVNVEFNPLGTSSTLTEYGGVSGSGDAFVAKYSSSGTLSGAFTLGNALLDQSNSITVDKTTGDFAITGTFQKDVNPIDFDPSGGTANEPGTTGATGTTDMFVAKYSTSLAYVWHKKIGALGSEKGTKIKLSGTTLFVTGSYEGSLIDFGNAKKITAVGGLDAFIAGYYWNPTATDTCLFAVSSGGATDDEGSGVAFANNKIVVSGYINATANPDIFFSQYSYTPPSACTLPAITTQPSSITRCTGTSAPFTVVATGTGLTYQWKKNGTNVSTGTGGTTASYTISPVATTDADNYTVDVTNTCGTVTSSAATLTVNAAVSITGQPSSITRCTGTSAPFTVTATGFGTLTYQWKKNGTNVSTGTGGTTASYTISPVATTDADNYTVDVTNTCGTVTSSAATLTVNAAVSITGQPSSITRCTGTSAPFTVTATGFGTLTYQWKKNGTNVSTGTGGTTASYTISPVATTDADNYTVDVTNTCGTVTSSAATLTVNAAVSITGQPSSITRCTGTSAPFTVTATGFGTLTYQWKKNGTNVSTGTGGTTASYTISPVATTDADNYTVDVTNTCGTVTSSAATLTVNAAVSITGQPSSITRCTGTSAPFTVTATGSGTLTYQWKRNNTNVSIGTGGTTASYTISPVAITDADIYTVDVTNTCGTVSSSAATLTVNAAVSITGQPSSITRCTGTSAPFTVTATGFGTLTYQWKKNGTNVSTGTGGTTASYTISPVATTDAANYTVDVTNTCGTVTSSAAALTVNASVSITSQPTSITRCVGASAPFTVTATGFGTLTYQWKRDNTNVSTGTGGTTANYTISAVVSGDAASYTVDITNTCGTVSSSAATLTVNTPVAANAGSAQTLCNIPITNLAGSNPSPGTGLWTVSSGTGTVTTPTSPTSGVTGLTVGGSSTFVWTVTNGACVTTSSVVITVSSPATADAGPDQALCNVTSTTLSATGTGTWSTFSGTGTAATPSSATSTVNGLTIGASTTMRWTVTNGACSATSDMIISVSAPGTANAGSDQALCNTTSTTLSAAGSGTWSTLSGSGTATNPNSATSAVTGLTVGSTTVLVWTVSAGACSGTDQVSIVVSAPPTGSAGANQNLCGATTATLAATGTGTWVKTSGTGAVTNPTNANSGVTGLTVGASSVFEWKVTNGACSTATSTTIVSNAPVSITTQPASLTTLCSGNTFNVNVVATGSGTLTYQWKKGSSNAGGTSTGSSYSIPSVVFGDAADYTVDVTNSCGTVTSSIAQLVIENLAITTQPVGQTVCPGANVIFTVAATGPSVSYQWKKDNIDLLTQTSSSLTLNGVSASDAANYTVLVSGCSNSILSNAAALALSTCTSIEDGNNSNYFSIYPNPAATTLHVNGFAQDPIRSIMIVDVNGEIVYQENELNASSFEFSVHHFSQGLYHVILFTASGNKWIEKVEVAK